MDTQRSTLFWPVGDAVVIKEFLACGYYINWRRRGKKTQFRGLCLLFNLIKKNLKQIDWCFQKFMSSLFNAIFGKAKLFHYPKSCSIFEDWVVFPDTFAYQCLSGMGWWTSTLPRCLSGDAGRWQTPTAGEAFLPAPAGSGRESRRHLEKSWACWIVTLVLVCPPLPIVQWKISLIT